MVKRTFNAGPFEDALQMPIPEMVPVKRRTSQKVPQAQRGHPSASKASRP